MYAAVAAAYGVCGVPPAALNEGFAAAWRNKQNFDYSREAWFAVVRHSFGADAHRLPPPYFPALYERFAQADVWRIYDDVLPTLNALARRGVRLGVISNWDDRLRPLLANLDLSRFFEVVVVSVEVGCTKPAPAIFHHAAAAFQLPPTAILHVGDSEREDVAGARAAGLQAVRVDRNAAGRSMALASLHELATCAA